MTEQSHPLPAAVLWDMDGVLADTTDLHFRTWQTAMAEFGIRLTHDQFIKFFGRSPAITMKGIFSPCTDMKTRLAIRKRKEQLFNQLAPSHIRSTAGTIDWLKYFSMACPQAVASSAPLENIYQILEILDLQMYFQAVISGSPNHSKPQPTVFLMAADTLGVQPQRCLVVEDSPSGIEAAHRANIPVIAICTSNPAEKLSQADLVLPNLAALTPQNLSRFCSEHY